MNNIEQTKRESRIISKIIKIGIIAIAALIIFQAGQFVGLKRAEFSFRMADNYYNNFDHRGMMGFAGGNMMRGNFTESHGASGKIIKINLPNLTVSTPDNFEKSIYISSSTIIREFRDSIDPSKLKVDDFVVAVGEPNNNGQIEAKFIRVMPRP